MGILLWLVLFGPVFFFKHAEGVLRPEWWQWGKDKALSAV